MNDVVLRKRQTQSAPKIKTRKTLLMALIVALIAGSTLVPAATAIPQDNLKLNFEKWFLKDNGIANFPKWDDSAKSATNDITGALVWSSDSENLTGQAPFAVRFAAADSGGTWDFGDKCYSGEQFHIHTYKQTGTYTATYTPAAGEIEKITITVTETQPESQKKQSATDMETKSADSSEPSGFFGWF